MNNYIEYFINNRTNRSACCHEQKGEQKIVTINEQIKRYIEEKILQYLGNFNPNKYNIEILTQIEYDLLTEYDQNTIYFIVEDNSIWLFGNKFPIFFNSWTFGNVFPVKLI